MVTLQKIDEVAKRWNVSSDSSDKADDGWNSVDKQLKLF